MKRTLSLLVILLCSVSLALAQSDLDQTYRLETGTSITYPDGWQAEPAESLVVLTRGEFSRAIVIDYPLVEMLTLDQDTNLQTSVKALALEILEREINIEDIMPFVVDERDVVRYDTRAGGGPVSIVAVHFRNGTIGMLFAVGVSDATLASMVASFDNIEPAIDFSQQAMQPARRTDTVEASGTYFFSDLSARFTVPAEWTGRPILRDDFEYVELSAPDDSVTVLLVNLVDRVAGDTVLEEVLDRVDLSEVLDVSYSVSGGEALTVGNHATLRYDASIRTDDQSFAGEATVVAYSEGGFGLVLAYGDNLAAQRDALDLLIRSFNNALYGLDGVS